MPDCGMNVACPGLTAAQEEAKLMSQRLMWVDIIREVVRNAIGLVCVPFILWMLYQFVLMSPAEDKMNVMLLVIGYLGGLVTAIMGWYFGGAMRSAVAAAMERSKGGVPYMPGMVEAKTPPAYDPAGPFTAGVSQAKEFDLGYPPPAKQAPDPPKEG